MEDIPQYAMSVGRSYVGTYRKKNINKDQDFGMNGYVKSARNTGKVLEEEGRTMKHQWHKCDREDCVVCRGDLSLCTVCGLAEGQLTTDCPGERVSPQKGEEVYRGHIDFKEGKWVKKDEDTNNHG